MSNVRFELLSFSDLSGWEDHDFPEAFTVFLKSCNRLVELSQATASGENTAEEAALLGVCHHARALKPDLTHSEARMFFERNFQPHRVISDENPGFVTGYYEPELKGSREKSKRFYIPVYRKPADLVALIDDTKRARFNAGYSYMRQTETGYEPYPTRQEIEQGGLTGEGLEILYLEDEVSAFFMHIQGSARISLESGEFVRLTYAAKNGHPYSSIGRFLIESGTIPRENMSMPEVKSWLRADKERGRKIMWHNKSYIFFRELLSKETEFGPQGAKSIPLTPMRSLAVDASIHALGTPIWVVAEKLNHHGENGFRQLMIAQDVGSAILGPERGDIYWGSGAAAGEIAGRTGHSAAFFVLLAKGGQVAK